MIERRDDKGLGDSYQAIMEEGIDQLNAAKEEVGQGFLKRSLRERRRQVLLWGMSGLLIALNYYYYCQLGQENDQDLFDQVAADQLVMSKYLNHGAELEPIFSLLHVARDNGKGGRQKFFEQYVKTRAELATVGFGGVLPEPALLQGQGDSVYWVRE